MSSNSHLISSAGITAEVAKSKLSRFLLISKAWTPEDRFGHDVAYYMKTVTRKPVLRVSEQVRHKPDCTSTKIEARNFGLLRN